MRTSVFVLSCILLIAFTNASQLEENVDTAFIAASTSTAISDNQIPEVVSLKNPASAHHDLFFSPLRALLQHHRLAAASKVIASGRMLRGADKADEAQIEKPSLELALTDLSCGDDGSTGTDDSGSGFDAGGSDDSGSGSTIPTPSSDTVRNIIIPTAVGSVAIAGMLFMCKCMQKKKSGQQTLFLQKSRNHAPE
jgi:hypothetical protein